MTLPTRRASWPALLLLCAAPAAAQQGAAGGEWPVYGGDWGHTRYAPLDQIDATNVADLTIAWRWKSENFGPEPEGKSEVTPLMVDGVLYASAGLRRGVVAIDAATGETLWMWRMEEGERGERAPRRSSGRGVAYWSDGAGERRVLVVTPGYHLVALDADTGRPVPGFGKDGVVDLMVGLRVPEGVEPVGAIGSSSPPLVVDDVAIVGAALEVGLRPPSPRNVKGDVRGYDVRTGALRWTFHTIPEPGEPGSETWEDGSAEYTGNAGVWAPMSADTALGLVYLPVEDATSDYYGGHRPGANLYSSSLVALDASTGELRWHRQLVHHDIWDYDPPTAPILVDVEVDGRPVKTVVQLTKQAFAYVFDRVTGEPVWPMEERAVPASDVPGERTWPTQPFPTRPAPFDRQGVSEDDLLDLTPELRQAALEAVKTYRLGPLFTPPSLRDAPDGTTGTLSLPGVSGGALWEAGAVDPETGMLYVGSSTSPSLLALAAEPERSEVRYVISGGFVPRVQGLPVIKPPWGRITAIDLRRGEHVWMTANADTPEQVLGHPALQGVDVGRTGRATRAGLLVTRTLLLAGEGWGGSPVLRAHDKASGKIVAEIELPASQVGLPMTYLLDGRQYVVLSVGARDHPAELVALALPAPRRRRPGAEGGAGTSLKDGSETPVLHNPR